MFYLIGVFAFLADRILKIIALSYVSHEGAVLIPKFFYFKFYKNFGAAFGLKIPVEIIVLLSIVILFFILFYLKRETIKKIPRFIPQILILGAASNIFDRLHYGYVIDYFSFFNYSFFNIADLMIIFSLISVLYYYAKKNI
jgi:signal peptidase II